MISYVRRRWTQAVMDGEVDGKRAVMPGSKGPSDGRTERRPSRRVGPAKAVKRPTEEEVDSITRGKGAKRKGSGYGRLAVPHRLTPLQRERYETAKAAGFLSLAAQDAAVPLLNSYRLHCDSAARPCVCVVRRVGNGKDVKPSSTLSVDLSTLRMRDYARIADSIGAAARRHLLEIMPDSLWEQGAPPAGGAAVGEAGSPRNGDPVDEASVNYSLPIWRLPPCAVVYRASEAQDADALAAELVSEWTSQDGFRQLEFGNGGTTTPPGDVRFELSAPSSPPEPLSATPTPPPEPAAGANEGRQPAPPQGALEVVDLVDDDR